MFLRLCKKQKYRIEKQKDKVRNRNRKRKIQKDKKWETERRIEKQKNRMRNRTVIIRCNYLSSNAISSRFNDKIIIES